LNADQWQEWLTERHKNPSSHSTPLIMGILNVTPDSFSDGGVFLSTAAALAQANKLIEQGADILDIGGESTRPYAVPVPVETELARVIPVIKAIRAQSDICISIDTYKPEVMRLACEAGANVINDVYALQQEGAMAMAAQLAKPVVLMHMQGHPQSMQEKPEYPQGVVADILHFWQQRLELCKRANIAQDRIILDPGFGFGKSLSDNMRLLHQWETLQQFQCPLLLGVSRKSTLGLILDKPTDQRMVGGIALAVYVALKGVGIIRTHDVEETKQALRMIEGISA
jgi:dihydropteroate synthase